MSFFRAAQCFASAQDALKPPLPYSNAEAVKHAFNECSEGLSGVSRSKLDPQAQEWVSQLELMMDYSNITVPQGNWMDSPSPRRQCAAVADGTAKRRKGGTDLFSLSICPGSRLCKKCRVLF